MKTLKGLIIALMLLPTIVLAEGDFKAGDALLLQTSLLTKHYSSDSDHNEHQKMINVEWYLPTDIEPKWLKATASDSWRNDVRRMLGTANFRNSFSQRSTCVYAGGRYHFSRTENTPAYIKLMTGLLHG